MTLSAASFSREHARLLDTLAATENLLIIQDLDGVCMGLVRDPLARRINPEYVRAVRDFGGHFRVLTNGEHIGRRGVNRIVEQALGGPDQVREQGLYLPGLAAGGVQLQDRFGRVTHPGVTAAELDFLAAVPAKMASFLREALVAYDVAADDIQALVESAVLDNLVSPTLNINRLYQRLGHDEMRYRELQWQVARFMRSLLHSASRQGLADSFFVHYAPNLGVGADGVERLKLGDVDHAGTHDFQFMLNGAIKEVGVLVILNHYYCERTGCYPLGEDFNARKAPRDRGALLDLVHKHFDDRHMPRIIGVGDTVTAHAQIERGRAKMARGGSDRGFLTLVQELGEIFDSDNAVLYVDSSGDELSRPGLDVDWLLQTEQDEVEPWPAVVDITDPDDALRLNYVFAGGHEEYVEFFLKLAQRFRKLEAEAGR